MRISDWSSDVCSSDLLKALSVGAKACSGGRLYLYALAAAGEAGVDRAVRLLRAEIERGMKLMGAQNLADLGRDNMRWRSFPLSRQPELVSGLMACHRIFRSACQTINPGILQQITTYPTT